MLDDLRTSLRSEEHEGLTSVTEIVRNSKAFMVPFTILSGIEFGVASCDQEPPMKICCVTSNSSSFFTHTHTYIYIYTQNMDTDYRLSLSLSLSLFLFIIITKLTKQY